MLQNYNCKLVSHEIYPFWLKENNPNGTVKNGSKKTETPECLPTRSGTNAPKPCKKRKQTDDEITPFYRGAKGGLYFFVDGIKVYVPADAKSYVEANFPIKQEPKK